jgi:hypothetical protein
MSTGNSIVDRDLARAASKWRGRLFWRRTGAIGAAACLGLLLMALAMLLGWLTEPVLAKTLVVFILVVGGLVWLGAGILTVEKDPAPPAMAGAVERGQPSLLDRVHTLVALEQARRQPGIAAFYRRIAHQAQQLLADAPAAIVLTSPPTKGRLVTFLALAAATIFIYSYCSPWQQMVENHKARLAAARPKPKEAPKPDLTLELAAPTNALRERQPWGEVRITEPGRDLQVTKADVVPLQIEAAANEPMDKVRWASALNGQKEQPHDLPPPAEPRFAVYQPTLNLDELKLSDWDVLSYYARAETQASNAFASEVYFLEVRPFRDDLLKMPGGENGQAMQSLQELSSLISQQQHVIRQTHQHVQRPPETDSMREQDRKKLADAEADLGRAAQHLNAQMAGELENQPIGEALDHLARAEKELAEAARFLRQSSLPEGQNQERGALADLVAARKAFQQAVSDHPNEFQEKTPEESPPVADAYDKLKEMAEFRNEAKATEDFMQKLVARQQALSEKARPTNAFTRGLNPQFAQEERQIQNQLDQFQQQHPRVFKPVQPEADAAAQSLDKARQALDQQAPKAANQVQDATDKMQRLADAMREKSADRQLADAYKLKQMLDRQIEKMGQCEHPGAGGGPSGAEVRQTVADTRQTLQALKNTTAQPPTSEAFGPELREALNAKNLAELGRPLHELEQATTPAARSKPAGEAKEGLQKVSQAFAQSEPKAMQAAQRAAKAGEAGDFERGLAQLESLIQQMEGNRPLSSQSRSKQGHEALYNMRSALPQKGGSNERGDQILLALEKELKQDEKPVDVEVLKSVVEALRAFSVEMAAKGDPNNDKPEMTGLDPSRLPPAYRARIEKYFQKLSEK